MAVRITTEVVTLTLCIKIAYGKRHANSGRLVCLAQIVRRTAFPRVNKFMTKNVLFVCMGNICRSPAGESVMRRFAEEFGVDVEVDSAGTHDYHVGELADKRMRTAAESRGYELTSRGRQVTTADLAPGRFDLVLAMDKENHALLMELAPGSKTHIRLFSDYLDDTWPNDVPDPYYGEQDGFDQVLDMLEAGCPIILQALTGAEIFGDEFDA